MKRSKFSLSHYKLLSMNLGQLVPIGTVEVIPGDTVQHATNALVRASPLLAPVMHPVHCRIHHWFVPYRLIWEDFEDFITGGPTGADASVYPTKTAPASTGYAVGSLADYLGVPPGVADLVHSALPFRAYAMIWNEFYRDQDLETLLTIDETSGADTTTNVTLQHCDWEKDYFTSARPWEQKGPAVTLPLGTTAPVSGLGFPTAAAGATGQPAKGVIPEFDWDTTQPAFTTASDPLRVKASATGAGARPQVFADLSEASAVTVNTVREAFAIQRYQEARARFGSRYVEYLRYLGIKSSDARLQRPEYLGGGKETIQFSEVLQTAEGTNPVGELRGHGISALRSNRYRRFFEEHGIIISVLSIRPRTMYTQGLQRFWNRRLKEDFWQMELQHIGQQEVLNKEVYAAHASPDGVFGYQDRYDEYRRLESAVAGEFRESTLDFWHLARVFGSSPALNATFVKCVPDDRIFAAGTEVSNSLYVMARHNIQARRQVAKFGSSFTY